MTSHLCAHSRVILASISWMLRNSGNTHQNNPREKAHTQFATPNHTLHCIIPGTRQIARATSFKGYLCVASTNAIQIFTQHSLFQFWVLNPLTEPCPYHGCCCPGPTFIKPDQLDPWIKDQITITLLPTISHLLLPNFVSCGRAWPSHMTQNLVTVGAKLWTADRFLVDPWSMDYADPVW